MSEPTRLSRRVAELAGCSRADAQRYIEGGWVRVDGRVIESPQAMVADEKVELDAAAVAESAEPATILFHKPGGVEAFGKAKAAGETLVSPDTRWPGDASGVRLLQRHFVHLEPLVPLDREASGLMVLTQDPRVRRRLVEDANTLEHEYVVEVAGDIAPYGLAKLNHGLNWRGRPLPPCKVSWQNEVRLRFAIKGVQPGQLHDMCAQVGLEALSVRRLRIGRVGLAKMPVGQWRYLPVGERF